MGSAHDGWHSIQILNLIPELTALPTRKSLFPLSRPEIGCFRTAIKWIEKAIVDDSRYEFIGGILEAVPEYSTRLNLIRLLEKDLYSSEPILSADEVELLKKEIFEGFSVKSIRNIDREWDLARVIGSFMEWSETGAMLSRETSPDVIKQVIKTSTGSNYSGHLGSRKFTEVEVLDWSWFLGLFGGEEEVRYAISNFRKAVGETRQVLLVERYLDSPGEETE